MRLYKRKCLPDALKLTQQTKKKKEKKGNCRRLFKHISFLFRNILTSTRRKFLDQDFSYSLGLLSFLFWYIMSLNDAIAQQFKKKIERKNLEEAFLRLSILNVKTEFSIFTLHLAVSCDTERQPPYCTKGKEHSVLSIEL